MKFLAAALSRLRCTRTSPSSSTARHRYLRWSLKRTTISSRYHFPFENKYGWHQSRANQSLVREATERLGDQMTPLGQDSQTVLLENVTAV